MKEPRANKSSFPRVGEGYSKLSLYPLINGGIPIIGLGYLGSCMISSYSFQDSLISCGSDPIYIEAEYLNNPFVIQSFLTLQGSHYSLRGSSLQDQSNKLNLYGTSKSLFHKFYIDYCIHIISTNFLNPSQYIVNFLDFNLLNLLGPRSIEKGSYHRNRFINLFYSGNLVSYLLLNLILIPLGMILLLGN